MEPWMVAIAATILVAVIGGLLNRRDNQQQREFDAHVRAADEKQKANEKHIDEFIKTVNDQIKNLYAKHDHDVAALQELRIQIASKHYERGELDQRFDKLESTFKNGFSALGAQIAELVKEFRDHKDRDRSGQ